MRFLRFLPSLLLPVLILAVLTIFTPGREKNGFDLSPMEELGKKLFFDKISSPGWVSCATCHDPKAGWTGPTGGINQHGAVYRGAVPVRFGNRKPPSAAYATQSPIFHFDEDEGIFVGGSFWDGRATGMALGNPAADQAGGPFLNPVEQNMPSKVAVCLHIASSKYASLFEDVWGEDSLDCSETDVHGTYDRIALALAAYEGSAEVNQFSSKYDAWLAGQDQLTEKERLGMELFEAEDKGNCAACHPAPFFTDFTFDNLGVPKNLENPFYRMDRVLLDNGDPINEEGSEWIDPGLGGFLESQSNPDWAALASENHGKHKVPTLRNVAKGPGRGFPKAYMHNGVFKSLEEVVHFYNTRDVGNWPEAEVPDNVNSDELGDLGLTAEEEDALVAFLKTLSDGYRKR
jgi:cytochrome c peroxidase